MTIRRVVLSRIRCFQYLELNFLDDHDQLLEEVIVTGAHMSGKSTILKAIEYCLEQKESSSNREYSKWLRAGSNSGYIEVQLQGEATLITYKCTFMRKEDVEVITRSSSGIYDSSNTSQYLPLCVCVSFLHSNRNLEDSEGSDADTIETDENEPIFIGRFHALLKAIGLDINDQRMFKPHNLSDTESRLMGLVAQVETVCATNSSRKYIDGYPLVLLIDDLGHSLHPNQQRALLVALRRIYGSAQIIGTSMEPLVVQQTKKFEAFSIRNYKTAETSVFQADFDPRERTIAEILQSSLFNMESTESIALEKLRNTVRPPTARVDQRFNYADFKAEDIELRLEFQKRFQDEANKNKSSWSF